MPYANASADMHYMTKVWPDTPVCNIPKVVKCRKLRATQLPGICTCLRLEVELS